MKQVINNWEVIDSRWLDFENKGFFVIQDFQQYFLNKREVFLPNERDWISKNTFDWFVKIKKIDGSLRMYSYYRLCYWVFNDKEKRSFFDFNNWMRENNMEIHHIDFNHFNNEPNNLTMMSRKEHEELHKAYGRDIG